MRFTRTFFLFVIVLGLGAYIWFYEQHGMSAEERREMMRRAFDLPVEHITRIGIRTPEYETEVFRAENGEWRMREPEGARAAEPLIRQTLSRLRNLGRGELITPADMRERGQTLADFGLAVPRLVLSLQTPAETREYRIGDPNPLGNALYVKEEQTQNVMLVSSDLVEILPSDAHAFRDRDLFPLHMPDVSALTLIDTERAARLLKTDGHWRFMEPVNAPADESRVTALLAKLGSARIDGMLNRPDTGEDYGFVDGSDVIRLRTPSTEVPYEVTIGGDVPDKPDLCYARISGQEGLVLVSKGLRQLARTETAALRDRRLVTLETEAMEAVEVAHPDRLLRIARAEDGWRVTSPVKMAASGARVQQMIQYWRDARVEDFLPPNPDAKAAYRVRFIPTEGDAIAFEVLESDAGAGRVLIRREGGDAVLRVVPDLVRFSPVEVIPYLSRGMLRFDPARAVRVSLQGPDASTEVVRVEGDSVWRLAGDGGEARQEAVNQVLGVLSDLRAADLLAVNPASLEPYGLNRPRLRVSVGLGGVRPENRTLLVSSREEDGSPVAMVQGEDVVFQLTPGQWEALGAEIVATDGGSEPKAEHDAEKTSP